MEDKNPWARHDEQIKTLFKKVEDIDNIRDFIHNLDKNMAVQTELMKNVVDHNKKQDKRMEDQQEIIVKINSNLTELNEGQKTLNNRVGKLEQIVDENEDKNTIDLRDIRKKKTLDFLYKYAAPIVFLSWLINLAIQYFKG